MQKPSTYVNYRVPRCKITNGHMQQHSGPGRNSKADLNCGVDALVDVHSLAGICIGDDDLGIVHMVLDHPFPALLALCPGWLACCRLGRGSLD